MHSETTGQGGYVSEEPAGNIFKTAITGDKDADIEYADAGIIQADGSYKFTEDTVLQEIMFLYKV